ncbi:MAG: terminase small subunit [Gammaproteobacteria bacterium]
MEVHNCNAAQICALFGISEHVLREWVEAGCPIVRRGERGQSHQFHATQVFQWWRDRKVEEARRPDNAAEELSRLRRSQRELIDVGIEQRRARLIPATDARRAWAAIRDTCRRRMARVMDDAVGKDWPPHVLDELELSIAEALAELARDPVETGGDTGSAE